MSDHSELHRFSWCCSIRLGGGLPGALVAAAARHALSVQEVAAEQQQMCMNVAVHRSAATVAADVAIPAAAAAVAAAHSLRVSDAAVLQCSSTPLSAALCKQSLKS